MHQKKTHFLLSWFIVLIFSSQLWAAPDRTDFVQFQPMQMALQKKDVVIIRGHSGSVEVLPHERMDVRVVAERRGRARWTEDDWKLTIDRQGDTVFVQILGPGSKDQWQRILRDLKAPDFTLKVYVPANEVKVFWQKGNVSVAELGSVVQVNLSAGDLRLNRLRGPTRVYQHEGRATIHDMEASLDFEGFNVELEVKNLKGRAQIENFSGKTRLYDLTGDLAFKTFSGDTEIDSSQGRLNFENGRKPFHIKGFKGEIRGRSAQGAVYALLQGDSKINVRTEEAPVVIRAPGSGAHVNIGSREGALITPQFLQLKRYPDMNLRLGRLRGSDPGSIYVRTTSGNIQIQ